MKEYAASNRTFAMDFSDMEGVHRDRAGGIKKRVRICLGIESNSPFRGLHLGKHSHGTHYSR